MTLACILALACLAGSARAARIHTSLLSITQPGESTPLSIAVNQTTHHFYVGNPERVFNFEGNGQLDPVSPELTGTPTGQLLTGQVAIDNSGGAHGGDVYAPTNRRFTSESTVQQYGLSGEATTVTITGSAVPPEGTAQGGGLPPVVHNMEDPNGSFRPQSLAVDGSGDVLVQDQSAKAIDIFTPAGVFVRQLAAGKVSGNTKGIAVDAAGDIYLAVLSPAESELSSPGLIELDPSGQCVQAGCAPIDPTPIESVAVDQAGGKIYTTAAVFLGAGAGWQGSFREYDATTHALLGVTSPAQLHFPQGIGVNEATGEVIVADKEPPGEGTVQIYGPVEIVPDVVTLPPGAVGSGEATLKGEIGAAGVAGATCAFQYVSEEEFRAHGFEGAKEAGCTTGPFSGEAMNPVEAKVEGLRGGTIYHERIVGTNPNGTDTGEDVPFTTAGPTVGPVRATEVTETAATLTGTVDPNGSATTYAFEYVTRAAFGQSGWAGATRVPAGGGSVGSGTAPVPVSGPVEGLTPGTPYLTRIHATSTGGTSAGETTGEEVAFETYGTPGAALPDGRRYEQASPVGKNGANVQGALNSVQASLNGERVTFFANTGIPGGDGSQQFPTYMATRAEDGSGWSTQGLLPPASFGPRASVIGWTEELNDTYDFATPAFEPGKLLRRQNSDGSLTQAGTTNSATNPFAYAGSSHGGAVALLESRSGGLLPGKDLAGKQNLYAYDQGANRLVVAGVMNDGQVPPGGAMAGPYNWFQGSSATPGGALGRYYTQTQHAISGDGTKVFFTAGGTGQLYVRLNPLAPQSPMDGEECREPTTRACTIRVSAPASGVTDPGTPAAFVGASAEGDVVYFLDHGKLTADATGGSGLDLYRYDLGTGALVDLTLDSVDKKGARVEGILGMGQDGRDVYLVAAGALTGEATQAPTGETNLYVLEGEEIRFIARLGAGTVEGGEGLNWTPFARQFSPRPSRVSADGRTLLLRSARRLTGYDNEDLACGANAGRVGPCAELYLYRTGQGLSCVSCDPTGQAPTGPAGVQEIPPVGATFEIGSIFMTRNLSADGRRVIFDSPDRLVGADHNDVNDVYEWEAKGEGSCAGEAVAGGCLFLISGGAADGGPSWFGDADEEGGNVFFFTAQSLVAQDKDELVDVYDAKVGGGIPGQEAVPGVPCESASGCHGSGAAAPGSQAPGTSSFAGPGNVRPKPGHCRHGKVRRHGRCVARPRRHKGHKHHRSAHGKHGAKHNKHGAKHGKRTHTSGKGGGR